jgi:cyanophycinase
VTPAPRATASGSRGAAAPGVPGGWRVLLGGSGPDGMDPRFVRRFIELAGGAREARIAVVPTASEERADTIARYIESFRREDVHDLEILDVRDRAGADDPDVLRRLRAATGVMFTGGDQLRLLDFLMGTEFAVELGRLGDGPSVIGGSSAGSMALGDPAIVRGDASAFYQAGAIRQAPGLGLVPGMVVDTHLVVRGRLGRLVAMAAEHPDALAVGIEEDAGLEISPAGVLTVLDGAGVVCIVDGRGSDPSPAVAEGRRALSVAGLALHVLAAGDRFDLRERRVLRD